MSGHPEHGTLKREFVPEKAFGNGELQIGSYKYLLSKPPRYTLRQRFLRFLGAYVETVAIWLMDRAEPRPQSALAKVMEPLVSRQFDRLLDPLEQINFPTIRDLQQAGYKYQPMAPIKSYRPDPTLKT